jgi:hypothetical protein
MLSAMTQESAPAGAGNDSGQDSVYPCPVCHTLTTLEHPCPGCGRAPDPNAAAVITLDGRILRLRQDLDEAKNRVQELTSQLMMLMQEREAYATAVRAAVLKERSEQAPAVDAPATAAAIPALAAAVTAPPVGPATVKPVDEPARAETSTKTVQTLLFVLGGIILGIAAIVFTGVAFTRFGLVGRAVILSTVTLVTLAVPPLVRRRGLRGTAETFAALGFLFVLLDGYAAWYVNLLGIQDSWDLSFYQAMVLAVTACLALGYALAFQLTGPRFVALTTAQPVLPLIFANLTFSDRNWVFQFCGVALLNAVILAWRPKSVGLTALAWVFHGIALVVALRGWTGSFGTEGDLLNSLSLMALASVFVAGAWVSGAFAHRLAGAAVFAVALAGAIVRPVFPRLDGGARQLAFCAMVTAAIALLAWVTTLRKRVMVTPPEVTVETEEVPEKIPALWSTFDPVKASPPPRAAPEPVAVIDPWSLGARIGAGLGLLVPALIALGWALWLGTESVVDAIPWWHGSVAGPAWVWELPLAITLVTAAGALLSRGAARDLVIVVGAVAISFTLPQPSIVDMVVAAALLVWVLLVPSRVALKGGAAVLLIGHALATGLGEPVRATLVMAAVFGLGIVVGTVAPRRGVRPLGGVFTAIGDLVLPWLAFTTVAAFGGSLVASWRMLLAFVILVPILGSPRSYRGYLQIAGLVTMLYPLWPDLPPGESQALYAAGAAVAGAILVFRPRWPWTPWAVSVPILATLAWTFGDWWRVLPATAPRDIWAGGGATPGVDVVNAIALTVLVGPVALTLARAGRQVEWRRAVAIGAYVSVLPVLMWLAVAGAPWPTLPAVTLLFGLSMLVRRVSLPVTVLGVFLTLSGLSGASLEKWTTIVALSLVVVAMAAIAMSRSPVGVRIGAWSAGAVAKVLLAYTIGETAGWDLEMTAYLVLVVAGILLGLAYTPLARELRPAVEAAAHACAAVAVSLTAGSSAPHATRAAAGVFAIWGVAIGLTALRSRPVVRAALAGTAEAIAWCLVLFSYDVGTLEAYTLPIAVVAVVVGVLSARNLSSWAAYGPAVAAAMLPTLGAILFSSGQEWRRLLLGAGALAVVLAGAVWRKQAPFVLGGIVLIVLALHEIVLVWTRLQTWIPLTVIGLILVGLAITYERRRRDLNRLREAVANMS